MSKVSEKIRELQEVFIEEFGVQAEVTVWVYQREGLTDREAKTIQRVIIDGSNGELEAGFSDCTNVGGPKFVTYQANGNDSRIYLAVAK